MSQLILIPILWFAAVYSTGIVATVVYDLIAKRRGWRTVSGDVIRLASRYQTVAVMTAGVLGFVAGCLVGHLFLGQAVVVSP